jgi:hypothetical protein
MLQSLSSKAFRRHDKAPQVGASKVQVGENEVEVGENRPQVGAKRQVGTDILNVFNTGPKMCCLGGGLYMPQAIVVPELRSVRLKNPRKTNS